MSKKEETPYFGAMKEMREALERMQARGPGRPCVAVSLDNVFYYKDADGETRAVMPVQDVIALVDEIMRA